MFDKHPVAIWTSIIATVVTLAASTVGGWYFVLSTRGVLDDQSELLARVRAEQEYIRRELTEQTADLESIRTGQAGFKELREQHQWLRDAIGDENE